MPRHRMRTCAVQDCAHQIPASRIMCRPHWQALPQALQQGLVETVRLGRMSLYRDNLRQAEQLIAAGGG